jgi:hypothetical protein
MDSVYFVMAILGCGDDGLHCRQERIEPVRYRTVSECRAAIDAALLRNVDLSYPMIGATCQQSSARMVENRAAQQGS